MDDCDFSGWATRPNRKCSDGRTIRPDAFAHMDGMTLPMVWQHQHNNPDNILGHVKLEHRGEEGTYAYGFFNETPNGQNAKIMVQHGDVQALSIYANQLKEHQKTVLHGQLIEVSLVLAGANPGARIDYIQIQHSDDPSDIEVSTDEAVIISGEALEHGVDAELEHKTYEDVFKTLDDDQRSLFAYMIQKAAGDKGLGQSALGDIPPAEDNDNKDGSDNKTLQHTKGTGVTVARNVFDQSRKNGGQIQHSSMTGSATDGVGTRLTHAQVQTVFADAKKMGSLKEAIQHNLGTGGALAHVGEYGITNVNMLFPDAQLIEQRPDFITRKMEWVEGIINGTSKAPFNRLKSRSADLTHEGARAKGYIKATMKKEQFFEIAERETYAKTIYKKQKLDRDDIIDVTEFDLVAWMWIEMYFMIREEAARAILVGDGREPDDEDKIDENKIRPIAHDDPFYTDVIQVPAEASPSAMIEAVLRGRYMYKGTAPKAYMTNSVLTDMLLEKDGLGRRLYDTEADLARALRVTEIVEVDVMEGVERDGGEVLMIIVNISDYTVGTARGGELTKFDDFDIDFNQHKYLIETRFCGALMKHKRAQVVIRGTGTMVTPTMPSFNSTTGVITIPAVPGVTYRNQFTNAPLAAGAQTALDPGQVFNVKATPNAGYYFPHNFDNDWQFTRQP